MSVYFFNAAVFFSATYFRLKSGKIILDPTKSKSDRIRIPMVVNISPAKTFPAGEHLDGAVLGHQLIRSPAGRCVAPRHNPDQGGEKQFKGTVA
jgi:hypothetical protein